MKLGKKWTFCVLCPTCLQEDTSPVAGLAEQGRCQHLCPRCCCRWVALAGAGRHWEMHIVPMERWGGTAWHSQQEASLLPLCTDMKDSSRCKNQAPRFQDERNLKSKWTQNLQGKFWIKFLLLQRKAGPCPWKCFCALKARSQNIFSGALRGCLNVSSSWTGEYMLIPTVPALEGDKAFVSLALSLVPSWWLLCSHVLVHFAQTFHCSPLTLTELWLRQKRDS